MTTGSYSAPSTTRQIVEDLGDQERRVAVDDFRNGALYLANSTNNIPGLDYTPTAA